ncbi:MAG: FecR domain-containing protein [Flavobacteriaceae bacterium]|jgi:ferric-dicitrate binding protein FerR (iron transport regulator)|nr:FecR domain-containing protein [Flavobacteriaceae bacterium]
MIKQFKQILSKYAEERATKEEKSLVNQYFDKMQVNGISSEGLTSTLGEKMKKKIDYQIKPLKRTSWGIYYKIAAVAVILISLSYVFLPVQQEVELVEQYAAKGQQLQFYLSDSTFVHLNSNSKLIYPKSFDGTHREVQLEGEAFFEVTHTNTDAPFTVVSSKLSTQVLGTKFNVNDSPNETVQVSVYEGKVRVEDKQTKQYVVLRKDEQARWDKSLDVLQRETIEKGQFNQWYKGEVKFDKMSIQEVITVLNRRFDTQLYFASGELPTATISGDFTSDKIEDILKSLQFIYGIQYKKQANGQITLYAK